MVVVGVVAKVLVVVAMVLVGVVAMVLVGVVAMVVGVVAMVVVVVVVLWLWCRGCGNGGDGCEDGGCGDNNCIFSLLAKWQKGRSLKEVVLA